MLLPIRNVIRYLKGKPPLEFSPGRLGMTRREALVVGAGLTGLIAGATATQHVLQVISPPAIERTSSSIKRGELLAGWWETFTAPIPGVADAVFVKQEEEKDKLLWVSEGAPWGLSAARQMDSQEKFNQVLRGVKLMMERGLPAWQGYVDKKTGKFVVTNRTSALDADIQIANELIQAAQKVKAGNWQEIDGFDYTEMAQRLLNLIYEKYVDNDGAFASLAPTPYDRGGVHGHLKNLSYVSIAILEVFRDFDSNPGHKWEKIIEDEQISREVVIEGFGKNIPDWIILAVKTRLNMGKLENEFEVYSPAGRSFRFGYDAVRTLWMIAQDALYCKDPSVAERNVRLARLILDEMTRSLKIVEAVDAMRIHDYGGQEIAAGEMEERFARQDMLYAGYAALAYAAGQDRAGLVYRRMCNQLREKMSKQNSGLTGRYYESSLFLWSTLMLDRAFIWEPLARYEMDKSKDIQNILQRHPYPWSHAKFLPFYPGFNSYWGRTPGERAELDLVPAVVAAEKQDFLIPIVGGRANLNAADQMKALWMMDGAAEIYSRVLSDPTIQSHPYETLRAAQGLEGTIREGGFLPFEVFRRYSAVSEKQRSPFSELGVAQSLIDTYEEEMVKRGMLICEEHLASKTPEIFARAAILYAEGAKRLSEPWEEKKGIIKNLDRATERVSRQIKEMRDDLFDKWVDPTGHKEEDKRGFKVLMAVLRLQKAEMYRARGELLSRKKVARGDKERLADYKTAVKLYKEVLWEELTPEIALSALLGIFNAEKSAVGIGAEVTGDLSVFQRKARMQGDPRIKEVIDIIDSLSALLDGKQMPTALSDKGLREGIARVAKTILEGKLEVSGVEGAVADWDTKNKAKIADYVRYAKLALAAAKIEFVSETESEAEAATRQVASDFERVRELSPMVRVRAFLERVVYFLEREESKRAEEDCVGILRMIKSVRAGATRVSSPAVLSRVRTLGFIGRTIQALVYGPDYTRQINKRKMEEHLARLGKEVTIFEEKQFDFDARITSTYLEERIKGRVLIIKKVKAVIAELKTGLTEFERAFLSSAEKALEDDDYEAFSDSMERLLDFSQSLRSYEERMGKGERAKVMEELELLAEVEQVKKVLGSNTTEALGAAEKLLAEAYRKFYGDTPYTTDWFKRIIGAYQSVAWLVFNRSEEGKKNAIGMMHRILDEDAAIGFSAGSLEEKMVELIGDIESNGFIRLLVNGDPYQRSGLLKELAKMYIAANRGVEGRRYLRRALNLSEDSSGLDKEIAEYKGLLTNPNNQEIIARIIGSYSGNEQIVMEGALGLKGVK